jgi:hypothetical protein
MFIANLNVFIAALAGASYLLSWILDTPVSRIGFSHGRGLMVALVFVAAVLIAFWAKWGLTPPRLLNKRIYVGGQVGIAMASAAFVGGIALSLYAASISAEDEYWSWVLMLDRIGPVGAAFFIAALGLFIAARTERPAVVSQP